jgi:hypothetical protein
MFDLDLLKAVLGVISILGGTVSGMAALLVDFKDKKSGRVTKWGRYALYGIATSFFIGTSNLWIDYSLKSRDARDAAEKSRANTEKTLQIVTDINRALNPFKDVRISFSLSYPFDHPELARYQRRLAEGVRALLPDIRDGQTVKGVSRSMWSDHTILAVKLHDGSPLLPNPVQRIFSVPSLFSTRLNFKFF